MHTYCMCVCIYVLEDCVAAIYELCIGDSMTGAAFQVQVFKVCNLFCCSRYLATVRHSEGWGLCTFAEPFMVL